MMFDEFTKNMIVIGKKTVTRRVVRNNRRPAVPDTIHKIKISRDSKIYGYIKIISCHKEKLKDITYSDVLREGFTSKKQYLEYFMRINNVTDLDTEVWVINFEKVRENNGGNSKDEIRRYD